MNNAGRLFVFALLLTGFAVEGSAQFRSRGESMPTVSESIRSSGDGLMFGWLDPNRLMIHNSYELSYTTLGGGQGMSLGTLTSSLSYQISNPLSVSFDVSLMHQPFGGLNSKLGQDFSGVYLTRAQLDYRPSKNMLFQIQFRQLPAMYWLGNYFGGYNRVGTGFFDTGLRPEEEKP